MNKELVKNRFAKSVGSYGEEAFVQKQIAHNMLQHIKNHLSSCTNLLEIGCGTGNLSRLLLSEFSPYQTILNDICPQMQHSISDLLTDKVVFLCGDAETLDFPMNQNWIVSCSTFQWFTDLTHFFDRCSSLLSEEGYLIFSSFGKENMYEVSSITQISLPYFTKEELESILIPDYEIIHSTEEIIETLFDSPLEVLYHLKRTGVTGIKSRIWTKKDLSCFCEAYQQSFRKNNLVHLSYHPIYIIAKKRR